MEGDRATARVRGDTSAGDLILLSQVLIHLLDNKAEKPTTACAWKDVFPPREQHSHQCQIEIH